MTDPFEHLAQLSAHELKPEILDLVRTEGLRAAIRAAVSMLNSDRTPAAARASLVGLMFKLGLEKSDDSDDPFGFGKMSPDELEKTLARLKLSADETERRIAERQKLLDQIDDVAEIDIFA